MSYLDQLKARIAETGVGGPPTEPTQPSSVSFVGATPRPISEIEARSILREWHGKLEPLAECPAPDGFERAWWRQAVRDSWWVYANYCSQAVRTGWSELDLFGVLPFNHRLGGLVPRLAGARNLKLEGGKAIWSNYGVRDWTCVGAGNGLTSSGIRLLWDLGQ